ncbi:MAG: hypothetical protein LAT54_04910 [Cryomorphaceae bacterium]|nr:hypothetical protein [Cryomorphaceae bacterium]
MCLYFFVISTGLQAFPDWSVSLSINGDECDGHTLNVYSNFATVQPNSRAYVEVIVEYRLQGSSNPWHFHGGVITAPSVFDGNLYGTFLDPYDVPQPYQAPQTFEFRAHLTLHDAPNAHEVFTNIEGVFYPSFDPVGIPEIQNAELNDNGYYELSNCFPETHFFDLNSINVDLGGISIRFYESDQSGGFGNQVPPTQIGWTRPPGGVGIYMPDYQSFLQTFNISTWFDFLSNNTGYFMISIEYEDYCFTDMHQVDIHIRINSTPAVADFDFQMDDPATPINPPTIFFPPSQDINNPVEIGSGSGRVNMASTSPYYAEWEMIIEKWDGNNFNVVGGRNETSPTYSQSQFNPFNPTFYPNPSNNPVNNIDELYKIELVLSSPNCPDASLMSYFTVPAHLEFMRYAQTPNIGDVDANWHTQTSGYNAVNLHIADQYDVPENNGIFKTKVIAMDGRTVFQSVDVTTGTNHIELPSVSKGVYIIQAFDKNNQLIYNGKIQL